MHRPELRVAVIGAGAAGLCAARHLLEERRALCSEVAVFEQSGSVGGIWVYSEKIGTDEYGVPFNCMYRDLRTNLPKEIMAFPDYAFKSDLPSFVGHSDVKEYLESYADHFKIRKHIQFHTKVELVRPTVSEDGRNKCIWEVTVSNLINKSTMTEIFDAVLVCSGHYSKPYIPHIPGIEKFKGQVMHSQDYRFPEAFAGKNVVLLGAGPSGTDIAFELSAIAKAVVLSYSQLSLPFVLPCNVSLAPGVDHFLEDRVVFLDGTEQLADIFMFCTGYQLFFPYLSQEVGLQVQESIVPPLYKHIVCANFPSLFFIGMCKKVCPFPHFHCQILFVLSILDGSYVLPSETEMNSTVEEAYKSFMSHGTSLRHFHTLGNLQWDYHDDLAHLGKFSPLPAFIQSIYCAVKESRAKDFASYKNDNYRVISDGEWLLDVKNDLETAGSHYRKTHSASHFLLMTDFMHWFDMVFCQPPALF
ncbi:flavin-containing monooxygenase FMO GS-OX-like 4 [Protopterus annectens]|uniref:flavin-containing monooxygenase FMO GS-OX-like 4 n=1 Tax=Protopterus annectens TaxID=7888 RepID=UPI001CFB6266|nr:flavin-containing monooxygenase FMO GS-OX-like 4 [Protopterus annectens]